jgi:hypothetical protein
MNAGRNISTSDKSERVFRSLLATALILAVGWALTGNASPTAILGGLW